jgi:hypothetical protein
MSIDDIHSLVWGIFWVLSWFYTVNGFRQLSEEPTFSDISFSVLGAIVGSAFYFVPAAWILSKFI